MKKILLIVCAAIVWTTSQAQWQPVPVSGSSADVSSMFCFGDDLMVGTLGDGIHKTTDNGDTWENVTGNMGNLFVNDIRGGGAPTVIWAATQGGAFYTTDHQNYQNCSNGLTQNDVRHFFFGDASSQNAEWMIGTNGGGVFLSAELTGPWSPSNTGLSGDALIINDGAGYTDDELHYAVIGTDGGVYVSTDTMVTWQAKNNGLTGDALKVNRVAGLGSLLLICTDGGFFYSTDVGESWTEAIEGEKFNSMIISMQPGAFAVYIVGENAWYTYDLENFDQLNLAGLQGEITSIALNSTHAFLGTSLSGKDGQKSGGIFRKPLDQLITSVESYAANAAFDDAEPVYPNPCRTSVHLPYTLHSPCSVKIEVTDNAGRVVVSREEGLKQAGRNLSTLSVDYLQQGIYFCSIYVNGMKTHTKKLVKVN